MTVGFFKKPDPLDQKLFNWPSGDAFTKRHLMQSVAIMGQIGSGKSSGSGLRLARTILKMPSGGLILASKPEDREWWKQRFQEAGRSKDLIVFAEDTPARCNFIDYEMKSGGDARSLTQFLTVTGEVLDSGSGRSNEQFWKKSEERILYNCISALMQGNAGVDAPKIQKFITTAAYKPETLADDKWQAQFHNQVLKAAYERKKTRMEQADYDLFYNFWLTEFPQMDDKPRSSILAGVNNTLHVYNSGIVREKISTETTTTPDDLKKGKYWLLDYPVHQYDASGKFLMTAAKFMSQKMILRRKADPGDIPIIIYSDECQNVINSFDAVFLAESRSHLGAMIYLTQSIHSFFNAMG